MPKFVTLYDEAGRAVLVNSDAVTAVKSVVGLTSMSTIYLSGGGFVMVKGHVFDVLEQLTAEATADA